MVGETVLSFLTSLSTMSSFDLSSALKKPYSELLDLALKFEAAGPALSLFLGFHHKDHKDKLSTLFVDVCA